MFSGILGKKIGMTQIFAEDGTVVPVTAIEAGPCMVTQVKSMDTDGYNAVQLGFGESRRLNRPEMGHLKKLGAFRHLREFRFEDISAIAPGQKVNADIFQSGDIVDVIGTSKGRGFAGVVKRHHFSGGPKTHGQSDRHRAPGSVGSGTDPGKVWKGQRMAGHMGNAWVTVRNLKVIMADPDRNLLLVRGAVPGARNGLLIIKKSTRGRST
ncbi:MAG: 50S ribosomal protein L3 [Dehalococcoidia bacterium]|nr:50S ribosomal protein L3 [Chloroflexota bacterium]MBT9159460.1 50S ribosomal protein L3 [Chloroflexota bacterium]MBT9161622.1 50S ribosomal protein L3 [Chloroflexota bacterium]